ncbi:uncharacterized protein MAM_04453 [Metarhizium album ARSEF 1941]|uniref:Uncharacterized protein n=1 Tax=Metarhizium album (strain ARSEF 1941) TaxID=1081103 RepID=A0A0B2WTR0_METAS|nr:uncharacterized protein MAM_04453 [Metarhizium album ARSEF 1941]KHN97438.1 hypothetical protein MAM_04453 [Metarhizium album ARSEF 1941]
MAAPTGTSGVDVPAAQGEVKCLKKMIATVEKDIDPSIQGQKKRNELAGQRSEQMLKLATGLVNGSGGQAQGEGKEILELIQQSVQASKDKDRRLPEQEAR